MYAGYLPAPPAGGRGDPLVGLDEPSQRPGAQLSGACGGASLSASPWSAGPELLFLERAPPDSPFLSPALKPWPLVKIPTAGAR